ncbi:hypothetical protein ACIA8O_21725 [Kitasatospora sp. NPDC051853]|uniref:hypothetical protein n=1 Tax=Kitasatospora sp. NPDC051853 TaxID=3364058 RepID=UPI0037A91D05
MHQAIPATPADLLEDLHIGVEHECKWALPGDGAEDPAAFVEAVLFDGFVTPTAAPRDYLQSSLYLDDARGSLAAAGHSLSVVVNSGSAGRTCVVVFKQAVHRRGWRDGLELRQRVPHRHVGARLEDPATLPVAHAKSLGLLTGELRPAGTAVQRRYKCFGRTAAGTEVVGNLDQVDFGDPGGPRTRSWQYRCLEIEVNSPQPAALADLGRLADRMDRRLGVPRDRTSKSQLAWAASHGGGTRV